MERTKSLLIVLTTVFALSGFPLSPINAQAQYDRPIAEAGLPRYAATDPVQLDGTGSYDPDNSGPLTFGWNQITGPSVVLTDTNTAIPTISNFVQTDEIQECEFELVVSDGELTSLPDTVKVIIVPDFGQNFVRHMNPPFDPNIPTLIFFGGGDCITGNIRWQPSQISIKDRTWNRIEFHDGFMPDERSGADWRTYYGCGDMIIVYLSSVAPDYKMSIQTVGVSTGGMPAVDAGIRLNLTYRDARYAVNRVTLEDATTWCRGLRGYSESIAAFVASSVDGEQCWLDNYVSFNADFYPNVLNVGFERVDHVLAYDWYGSSFTNPELSKFNSGVVAGAYWSVKGSGKNLQLASTPGVEMYKFEWYGDASSGYMDFYDEANNPSRLPEPVTLLRPVDVGDPNGAVLTCEESENAVGYQLLFGADPHRVMDYDIFSDTPAPPDEVITKLPFDLGWWTVRIYDQYGSTIYADPICIGVSNLSFPFENLITGDKYSYLQDAINDATSGDEIVVKQGIHHGKINFHGKNLIVRSTDPNDSVIVASTILTGDGNDDLITFSNNEDARCVLAGFTITNANNGIHCYGSSPTIVNCRIVDNISDGIKLYMSSNPTVSNCIIVGNGGSGIKMLKNISGRTQFFNSPTITNCTIVGNSNIGLSEGIPLVTNSIIYGNGIQITGSSAVVTYSSVQGGFPGEGNTDADPLFADAANGDYHLQTDSPCIDAGDPAVSVGSEPEPNGEIINMGAYGGTSEASKSP